MANTPTSATENASICDIALNEWLKTYPEEKLSDLSAKYRALQAPIKSLSESLAKLKTAQSRLHELHGPITECLSFLPRAINTRADFIEDYGDLGVHLPTSPAEMLHTLDSYAHQLRDYAAQVEAAYFSNLSAAEKSLAALAALSNFYTILYNIIWDIKDKYLPTEPDRRKPFRRSLYREFSALANNSIFLSLSPDIPNPLLSSHLSTEEFQSLLAVRKKAAETAKLLRLAR